MSALVLSSASAQIAFEDVTQKAGITYKGATWSIAWGDVNGDGYQDIFESGHGSRRGGPALYYNQGDGTFLDRADQVLEYKLRDFHGSAFGDFDNDGDLDLIVSSGGTRGLSEVDGRPRKTDSNVLWVQTPEGFKDYAEEAGVADPLGRGRSPVWVDVDRDGKLDLILTRGSSVLEKPLIFKQTDNFFEPCSNDFVGLNHRSHLSGLLQAHLFDNDRRHLIMKSSAPLHAIFEPIDECMHRKLKVNAPRIRGATVFDALVGDFTGDLRSEIVLLLSNNQSFNFLEKPNLLVVSNKESNISVVLEFKTEGIIDKIKLNGFPIGADPKPKVFTGAKGVPLKGPKLSLDSANPKYWGLKELDDTQKGIALGYDPQKGLWVLNINKVRVVVDIRSTEPITSNTPFETETQREVGRVQDKVFRTTKDGFEDISTQLGFNQKNSCRTGAFGDFDNDMDLDIYLGCQSGIRNLDNRLYENTGKEGFREVAGFANALGSDQGLADQVSSGDFDNDGFLDLLISNGRGRYNVKDGPLQLLRNSGNGNNWVKFKLTGTRSNRDAYGARVFVTAGGKTQVRDYMGGFRVGAQDDMRAHFGLAQHDVVEDVIVKWPNGLLERFIDLKVNTIHELIEGSGVELEGGLILTGQTVFNDKQSQHTMLALFSGQVDVSSLTWFVGDEIIAQGCKSCRFEEAHPKFSEVYVTGTLQDGRDDTAGPALRGEETPSGWIDWFLSLLGIE